MNRIFTNNHHFTRNDRKYKSLFDAKTSLVGLLRDYICRQRKSRRATKLYICFVKKKKEKGVAVATVVWKKEGPREEKREKREKSR